VPAVYTEYIPRSLVGVLDVLADVPHDVPVLRQRVDELPHLGIIVGHRGERGGSLAGSAKRSGAT